MRRFSVAVLAQIEFAQRQRIGDREPARDVLGEPRCGGGRERADQQYQAEDASQGRAPEQSRCEGAAGSAGKSKTNGAACLHTPRRKTVHRR